MRKHDVGGFLARDVKECEAPFAGDLNVKIQALTVNSRGYFNASKIIRTGL